MHFRPSPGHVFVRFTHISSQMHIFFSFRTFLNPVTSVLIQFGCAVVTSHVPLFCVPLLREYRLPSSWETLWRRECKLHVLLSAVWFQMFPHILLRRYCCIEYTWAFYRYITVPIIKHTDLISFVKQDHVNSCSVFPYHLL